MPKILISYRREDSEVFTGRIRDRLALCYGDKDVFMDVEDIPLGSDFRTHIRDQILQCEVVLVVIGPSWFGRTADGKPRLAQDADPVRVEVESALKAGRRTVPVLINGARMPEPSEVPESLCGFCYLNAATVGSGSDFHPNVLRLIDRLEGSLMPPAWRTRANSAIGALSLRKPVGRSVAAIVLALFGGSGAYANWDRIFPPAERKPAVFLLPQRDDDRYEDRNQAKDYVFGRIWGHFFDGLRNQTRFGVIPNSDEMYRAPSKFRDLFIGGQANSNTVILENIARYEDIVGRRIELLVRPNIRSADKRLRMTIDLGAFDRQNKAFEVNHDARVEVQGHRSRANFLAVLASYRIVHTIVTQLAPAPEIEKPVAEAFTGFFRDNASDLDPGLEAMAACETFACVNDLAARLLQRAKETDDPPKSDVDTGVEALRLMTGTGQP
jgi:TIR domain